MKERWKAVVGYEGHYEVSDMGRVRSLPRTIKFYSAAWKRWVVRKVFEKFLSVRLLVGYPSVVLCIAKAQRPFYVHELILKAFVGPRPSGHHAAHEDGTRKNSILSNLSWKTVRENSADRRRHGTMLFGEKAPWAKLTEQNIKRIKRLAAAGDTQQSIAEEFKICQPHVSDIVNGYRWSHV